MQNEFTQLCDTVSRRFWNSLRNAANRRGVSRCRPDTVGFMLPNSCSFTISVRMLHNLQGRGLCNRVNAGEKVRLLLLEY